MIPGQLQVTWRKSCVWGDSALSTDTHPRPGKYVHYPPIYFFCSSKKSEITLTKSVPTLVLRILFALPLTFVACRPWSPFVVQIFRRCDLLLG
jgi:hypothetical protein